MNWNIFKNINAIFWFIIAMGIAAGIGIFLLLPLADSQAKLLKQQAASIDTCVDAQRLAFAAGQRCVICEVLKRMDPIGYRKLGKNCSNYTDFETWRNVPAMEKICEGPCH